MDSNGGSGNRWVFFSIRGVPATWDTELVLLPRKAEVLPNGNET